MFWLEISPHDASGYVPHGRESIGALAQAINGCDFHVLTALNKESAELFVKGCFAHAVVLTIKCYLGSGWGMAAPSLRGSDAP